MALRKSEFKLYDIPTGKIGHSRCFNGGLYNYNAHRVHARTDATLRPYCTACLGCFDIIKKYFHKFDSRVRMQERDFYACCLNVSGNQVAFFSPG